MFMERVLNSFAFSLPFVVGVPKLGLMQFFDTEGPMRPLTTR